MSTTGTGVPFVGELDELWAIPELFEDHTDHRRFLDIIGRPNLVRQCEQLAAAGLRRRAIRNR